MLILTLLALAACSSGFADKSYAALAVQVVRPMIAGQMTGVQADVAARCIVDHATSQENAALARDLGVSAGSSTVALVRGILARADTQACLTDAHLPQPEV
jgi:hypothetical protein